MATAKAITPMQFFPEMTSQQYGSATKFYSGGSSGLEHAKFWEYVANSLRRYFDTGRVDYVNNMVSAALACGRFRNFSRVTKSLVPHDYNAEKRCFEGKANKAKLKKLRAADGESHVWETKLYEFLKEETQLQQTKPPKGWEEMLDARENALISLVIKDDATKSFDQVVDDLRKKFNDRMSAKAEKEDGKKAA